MSNVTDTIKIKYTNNIDEIKRGFIKIHNRYTLKRTALFSLVFLIVVILGVDLIIKNPQGFPGYIITALGLGMGVSQWVRPYMVRTRLIKTLEALNDENYTAHFYDEKIEIETDIIEDGAETIAITPYSVDTVTNPDVLENAKESGGFKKSEKTVINIATEELFSEEDNDLFLLYVNRALVYIFPKRCLSDDETASLRAYFNDRAI